MSHLWEKEKKRKKNKKGRKEKGIEKERKEGRKKELKKTSSAGFKWVRSGQLVFMSVKWERVGGGIGFTFLPS